MAVAYLGLVLLMGLLWSDAQLEHLQAFVSDEAMGGQSLHVAYVQLTVTLQHF